MYEVGTQQKCEFYIGSKYRSTYYFLTINCTQVPCFEDWKERLNGFGLGWWRPLCVRELHQSLQRHQLVRTPQSAYALCWRMATETIQMDWSMGEALCWLNSVWSYFGRPALSFWWHDWFNPRWAVALPNTTAVQQDFVLFLLQLCKVNVTSKVLHTTGYWIFIEGILLTLPALKQNVQLCEARLEWAY